MPSTHSPAGMMGSLVVNGVKSHQYKNFRVDEAEWPPKCWKLSLRLEGDISISFPVDLDTFTCRHDGQSSCRGA